MLLLEWVVLAKECYSAENMFANNKSDIFKYSNTNPQFHIHVHTRSKNLGNNIQASNITEKKKIIQMMDGKESNIELY